MWRAIFVVVALLVVSLHAAEVQFDASVDRTRLGQSEPILLTLRIASDENLQHVPAPKIALDDFHVEGPSVSSRIEMVNFSTTFTRELTYRLFAKRQGRIRIGSARIVIDGTTYQTEPIIVNVQRSTSRGGQQSNGADSGEFNLDDHLYVQARSDRLRAYVGQQVTVDFDLFYRFQLHNVGFKELPTFAGFWIKELFVAQQLQAHREIVDGVTFNVSPLRRVALFPTSSGRHVVESMAVSCEIPARRSQRRSMLDDFFAADPFFGRTQSALLQSDPITIDVLPLPEEGRPTAFAGAVGQFELAAHAQPTHVKAGDPVTLRVEIMGVGNMSAVQVPLIEVGEGIKMYDPTLEEEEQIDGGNYGGRRTYEFILIPETGGVLEIPPVRFAYFDPNAEQYVSLQSAPIYVHSTGEVAQEEASSYGLSRKDIEAVGSDIRHIKPDAESLGESSTLYGSALFWILQGAMPAAFVGLFFLRRHQERLRGDIAYARRRRARGDAGKRLERASQLLDAGDAGAFYGEIHRAVLAFLADHLNITAASLTAEACEEALRAKGVEEETVEALRAWLARCDYARFAQGVGARSDMDAVRQEAEHFITALEKKI
jgi:hypothetical protein